MIRAALQLEECGERAFICPPRAQVGAIRPEQRKQIIQSSLVFGSYEKVVDRESAYERLKGVQGQAAPQAAGASPTATAERFSPPASQPTAESKPSFLSSIFSGSGRSDSIATVMAKSAMRSVGSTVGREIIRGLMGSIFGGGGRRR